MWTLSFIFMALEVILLGIFLVVNAFNANAVIATLVPCIQVCLVLWTFVSIVGILLTLLTKKSN
jgi:formate-dependent nitrite reductase membrane component NrfD